MFSSQAIILTLTWEWLRHLISQQGVVSLQNLHIFLGLLVDFHVHTYQFSFSLPASNALFLVLNIIPGMQSWQVQLQK
jgi:uncharacterized membrane protein